MDLQKMFPLYKLEHDMILSRPGDMTVVFEVGLPEIFSQSPAGYEAVQHAWNKAIGLLEGNTVLHKQDWFVDDSYFGKFEGAEHSFHSLSSERFFAERPHLAHRCTLSITKRPKGSKLGNSSMSNLLRKSLLPLESFESNRTEEFLNTVGQLNQILADAGITLNRLTGRQIAGTSKKTGLIEEYLTLGNPEVLQDIQFKPEWRIGEKFVQLFSMGDVEDLPSSVSPYRTYEPYGTDKTTFPIGFATSVGCLLPCNHIYNQFLFIEDHRKRLKELEAKRLRLESLSNYSRENAISRDATAEFLNEAISTGRKAVKAHFNVMVWTDDRQEVGKLRNLTAGALAKMNVVPRLETVGAAQIFWAGLPGNQASFPVNETFDTFIAQATCFFNSETHYLTSRSPVGIRFGDRITGYPIHVDISDEPMKQGLITNRNKFVLGPSGSGKSFLTNHMMRTYYEQGAHVVLVDVGHSYRGLCELMKGYYFAYEEENPICFNPFYIEGRKRPDTEKKESLKTLLHALWKKDDESFRRSEYVALSNALSGYFELLDREPEIFPCFDTFYRYVGKEFRETLKNDGVNARDFDVENFMFVLRPYYRGGEFDYLLNARDNLDLLHQRFIVFELDNIKDHPILFPVVTLMIMEIFISKMRKLKGIRKIILIEEAWKAIAKEGMAEYIKYLFKTVRKFFGEAMVVTQDVEDIISSPIIKNAIINNADIKILLDQSKYQNKFNDIQELLGLTDQEKAIILSMNKAKEPGRNYKEVYISIYQKVFRVEVSKEEYLTYTTEEREKMKVEEYTIKYGSRKKAIELLAAEH
ncbi:TraG family conjugative transposon ATPase [Algoriphagus sp. AGSA1]|uniref:TraG family conjugative transposon ATPase n=1 Tax=unclassified Algoriphagus TaxID=2641541 RepID=UPI00178702F1|nr:MULTISPECIES: TraG family conjugative transposon ATPase [unclassified Algoriphagus]MCE7057598.1 TraG family conjugative transposon ATPase [Algoriphagus sp. AGSA1]